MHSFKYDLHAIPRALRAQRPMWLSGTVSIPAAPDKQWNLADCRLDGRASAFQPWLLGESWLVTRRAQRFVWLLPILIPGSWGLSRVVFWRGPASPGCGSGNLRGRRLCTSCLI